MQKYFTDYSPAHQFALPPLWRKRSKQEGTLCANAEEVATGTRWNYELMTISNSVP